MKENKENLEGIVLKLKEQGIKAGEAEKLQIVETVNKQANEMLSLARSKRDKIILEAKTSAALFEKNAQAAMVQASRDMVEATKIAVLKYLKSVFGKQCESLFTHEQYLKEILNVVLETIPGNKMVSVPSDITKGMEGLLLKEALLDKIELKPLKNNEPKIEIKLTEKEGIQYVVSAQDIGNGLFSLLNKDLVKRVTQNKEE